MSRWSVRYGSRCLDDAEKAFPDDRSGAHGLTFEEFLRGRVLAGRLQFALRWDRELPQAGEAVRTVHVVPPALGAVVLYGVLVGPHQVEIAGFDFDPGYRQASAGDPED